MVGAVVKAPIFIRVGPDIRYGRIRPFHYPAGYRILKLSGRISGYLIFYF